MEFKEDELICSKHAEIEKKLGIRFFSTGEPAMEEVKNIDNCLYFMFIHHKAYVNDVVRYVNIIQNNLFCMKKVDPSAEYTRLWKSKHPRVVFYDENVPPGKDYKYKFKGVFKFEKAYKGDDSTIIFKKIGNVLIIDDNTKEVSWRKE